MWDAKQVRVLRQLDGHASYVTAMAKVQRTEARTAFSYSLGDKTLRVWRQETVTESDPADELAELQASGGAMQVRGTLHSNTH